MKKDITAQRQEYSDSLPDWLLVRDTLRGETHIKSEGTKYLPKTSGQIYAEQDDPLNGPKQYAAYKQRAEFYDSTQSAYRAMVAMAHASEPEIELPAAMEFIKDRATKDGMPLEELAKRITREQLTSGRCPLVVDSDDEDTNDPYILHYMAEALPNWMGRRRYVFKLAREVEGEKGEVGHQTYYIEMIAAEGGYIQVQWEQQKDEEFVPVNEVFIEGFSQIPVVVAGSVDITDEIDETPLLPMAKACIASYQMSADYRHALFMCGQPTGYSIGTQESERPKATGSAAWINIENPQAKLGYLEFSGSGVSAMRQAIKDKKDEADTYGVKLTGAGAGEAAETLKVRMMSQQATLKSVVKAGGEAIEKCLKMMAEWMGLNPDEVSYTPNMDFADVNLDHQTLSVISGAIAANNLPLEILFEYVRKVGLTEMDDDQIHALLLEDREDPDDTEEGLDNEE